MGLLIDGEIKQTVFVNTVTPETFTFDVAITEGAHEFAIGFYNDFHDASAGIDRNLYVDKTTLTISSALNAIEAEEMDYHANGGQVGDYWIIWANGIMSEDVDFAQTSVYRFEIIAKGRLAYGIGPEMGLLIDGEIKQTVFVNTETPDVFVFDVSINSGTHEFAIGFYNDFYDASTGTDRNLYVDKTIIAPSSVTNTTTTSISAGTTTSISAGTSTTTTPIIIYQREYCSSDPTLILHSAIPEEGTMNVAIPDNLDHAISASMIITLFDPDISGEGYIHINDNDPIDLPIGPYDNLAHSFVDVPIKINWLSQGENIFRFTHVATWGYEVKALCVQVLFTESANATTTTFIPPPYTSTTTSLKTDEAPPTGMVIINQGDEATNYRFVTLQLSAVY